MLAAPSTDTRPTPITTMGQSLAPFVFFIVVHVYILAVFVFLFFYGDSLVTHSHSCYGYVLFLE